MNDRDEGLRESKLMSTLERLLEIPAADLRQSLDHASQLISAALSADKVDVFLLKRGRKALYAMGTSNTPMGRLQTELGLNYLPLANGGSIAEVFTTGKPHCTGHADEIPGELPGIVHALGVRSAMTVPFEIDGERRGVLSVQSAQPEFFSDADFRFLCAISRWIGTITHRAELIEQVTSAALEQGRRKAADELITVLAHDLRNHLTPLMGRLDLLRRRATRDDRADDVRDVDRASRSVARLSRLISDLLDVGRLEQGLFEVIPTAIDLVSLAQQTALALGTPGSEVRVEGPPELIVMADHDRIRQALENLVGNALKHSPKGKPVVIAICRETRPGGRYVHIDVVDEGPGVPPEMVPRLFERFAASGRTSGLGLGLYLASRIASAHGGTLTMLSPPGKGAAFRLRLPIDGPPNLADVDDDA